MQTTVSIPGMHCEGCANLIKDVSGDFPAVTRTDVDLKTKRVTLDHSVAFDFGAWKKAVEELGDVYKVQTVA